MECKREASKTSSTTPACPRRNPRCRSSFRLRSAPPLWRSEEFPPADVPGFVQCEDHATQQNTSGDCPFPLLTYFPLHAYSKLWTFICVGPERGPRPWGGSKWHLVSSPRGHCYSDSALDC